MNDSSALEGRVLVCHVCDLCLDRDPKASLVLLKRAGWTPPAALRTYAQYLSPRGGRVWA